MQSVSIFNILSTQNWTELSLPHSPVSLCHCQCNVFAIGLLPGKQTGFWYWVGRHTLVNSLFTEASGQMKTGKEALELGNKWSLMLCSAKTYCSQPMLSSLYHLEASTADLFKDVIKLLFSYQKTLANLIEKLPCVSYTCNLVYRFHERLSYT